MLAQIRAILDPLRRFAREESGLASIESILLIPLLFWAYLGTFVMFDAYKKQTDGLRVTYAVADAISREETALNQAYLDSMLQLSNFMTRSPSGITQRITIVCYSPKKGLYRVAWSRSQGPQKKAFKKLKNDTIDTYKSQLPILPLGDQAIVVETFMEYSPMWDVGLEGQTFDYWVFTRPRFSQVVWDGKPNWDCPSS